MKPAIIALAMLAGLGPAARAAPRDDDVDWPCQQIKVDELSVAAFWNGSPVDPASAPWRQNDSLAALVSAITQRRMPMEEAVQRIDSFAKAAGTDRDRLMPLLFAGVFDVLNRERSTVLSGLDRFGHRQKELADGIRQEGAELRAAQTATPPDQAKIADLTQRLGWDQQFFETRRQSLSFACDLPTVIEQRLYGLAQAIQGHLTE
jgi:hypothetical protein